METLVQIGSFQGKQALYGEQLPDVLKAMRKVVQVESAESSNRIEGIEAPRKPIQDMDFSTGVIRQLHTMMHRYLPQPGGAWLRSSGNWGP